MEGLMPPSWMSPQGAVRALGDLPGQAAGAVLDRGSSTDLRGVLRSDEARTAYAELAGETGRSLDEVLAEARTCLSEMAATHVPWAQDTWGKMGRWLLRAYDLEIDRSRLEDLTRLDKEHPLIWLPSHRSYLDTWVAPVAIDECGLTFGYTLGGANLNFFPFGTVAKRTGLVFIRRSIKDDPVYRLTLRIYLAHLLAERANLGWAIEGGRTRTGKLRQPRYGVLRYVLDAVESHPDGPEPYVVPVAIVYDQLHEVNQMVEEARGAQKSPEDLKWLVDFARSQSTKLGKAYVEMGEPIPLRKRLAELAEDPRGGTNRVERIAAEVCNAINKTTPVMATAIVTCALLAADRALTLDEVLTTVGPLAGFLEGRHWPVAGEVDLLDSDVLRATLADLVKSGVVSRWDGGLEPVWSIGSGEHLVAAFYRNTAIHVFVNRSIGELSLLAALEQDGDLRDAAWREALALRDLLKFEFFFSPQAEFQDELREELHLIAPEWVMGASSPERTDMRGWLERSRPHIAPLVLRPFLDAYSVVFERLAARGDSQVDVDELLDECLGVAQQWVLQHRVASEESVSLELFRPAVSLATHRGLLDPATSGLAAKRRALADEVGVALQRLEAVARLPLVGEPILER
jgi:glycerol-3-phosphate O-acyltransferase